MLPCYVVDHTHRRIRIGEGFVIRLFGHWLALAGMLFVTLLASGARAQDALDVTLNPLLPGKPVALSQYKGKVVLVVNVASRCGYTPQYEGLEALYKRYQGKGLVVLGIPANDFGAQERGSNQEIAEFCKANYGVSFPMFEKLEVPIGKHPLFVSLIAKTGQPPKWNFHKYLIDRQGRVAAYPSDVEPLSTTLVRAVEKALAGNGV
ncbi:MAG: glutathione peroxidase [Burkholderiales bacterium]|nr:glutathione peroxidase [Burkholderiales bacterium]